MGRVPSASGGDKHVPIRRRQSASLSHMRQTRSMATIPSSSDRISFSRSTLSITKRRSVPHRSETLLKPAKAETEVVLIERNLANDVLVPLPFDHGHHIPQKPIIDAMLKAAKAAAE